MSCYLMKLTPQEPYFFGNEKSFQYKDSELGDFRNRYYIAGEPVPAQTTLIGMLRYIMLPHQKADRSYSDIQKAENEKAVGGKSFRYDGKDKNHKNEFGKILHVYPLFLLHGAERLVVTPFDHSMIAENAMREENEKQEKEAKAAEKEFTPAIVRYTPFSKYTDFSNGEKCYPLLKNEKGETIANGYDAKEGITHSYMSVENGKIYAYSDIFLTDTRIGINRSNEKEGFFKKDHVAMKAGFSFGAYIELADDIEPPSGSSVVYLGQGKSLFTVQFTSVDNTAEKKFEEKIANCLSEQMVYCMSDMFLKSDIYADTKFAITETKDYRAYMTSSDGKITKDSTLYKLIRAGSIFIPINKEVFLKKLENAQVSVIGYNTAVAGKPKKEIV